MVTAVLYGALVIWLSVLYRTDGTQLDENPLLGNPSPTEQSAPATNQLDNSTDPVLDDSDSN